MPVLTGAVVIVGALCLIDLLLTFGVIRRLREHTEMLALTRTAGDLVIGLAAGKVPDGFTATDNEGEAVRGPSGLGVVAFFSTACPACPAKVPVFIDYVRKHPAGRDGVLAVVVGQAPESAPYLADLMSVARVCTESSGGAIGRAFAVQAFPAFFLLDAGGTVRGSGYDPVALPARAAA